ncbi:amidohydrolase family protein [Caulobacter sp. S45]|uniref:amidohydrolase family protein n=1 Tax=Caulobacter sp. S45 TaxID=1641861 RepID=UPI00131C1C26|nr:amidohydrolase family protein [Caulobacter sp. S45]
MRIDFHTHIIPPPGTMDWTARFGPGRWPSLTAEPDGMATLRMGDEVVMKIDDRFWSPERRLVDMDKQGVDMQVLSPIPLLSGYLLPAGPNQEIARFLNSFIADVVKAQPDRFLGMGAVPLQSPELAIEELGFLKDSLQMRAVQIGTCPAGRELDDPLLFPFFEACQELDFPVFVHPMQPLAGGDRLQDHYLPNIVGNPLETGLAITRLIVGGVLERLPHLRICFAHGGGAWPLIMGRVDKGFAVRNEMRADIGRPPSDYSKQVYVDSLTFDAASLRFVVDRMGPDRVVLGSDYPFGLGDPDPARGVEASGLQPGVADAVMEANLWAYLGGGPH